MPEQRVPLVPGTVSAIVDEPGNIGLQNAILDRWPEPITQPIIDGVPAPQQTVIVDSGTCENPGTVLTSESQTPKGRTLGPHARNREQQGKRQTPTPSEIDIAIDEGTHYPSSRIPGREVHYDPKTNTTAITEVGDRNNVISARRGPPSGIIK